MTHTIIIQHEGRHLDWIVCNESVPFSDVELEARIVNDHDGWDVVGIRNDATGVVAPLMPHDTTHGKMTMPVEMTMMAATSYHPRTLRVRIGSVAVWLTATCKPVRIVV